MRYRYNYSTIFFRITQVEYGLIHTSIWWVKLIEEIKLIASVCNAVDGRNNNTLIKTDDIVYTVWRARVLSDFTLVDLLQVRIIVKHTERIDLFVLNFPTKPCKNYVDWTCSFCAIIVRSTVDIVVQSGRRVYAWESKLTVRSCVHTRWFKTQAEI